MADKIYQKRNGQLVEVAMDGGGADGYVLPVASGDTLGGVKVGTNLTITDGVLAAKDTTYSNFVKSGTGAKAGLVPSPGTTEGTTKYLREDGTWQVPPDTNTDTHWTSHLYAGVSGTAANASTTNGNTTLVLADNSTVRANIKVKGSGATTVTSDASGNITISSTDTDTQYSHPSYTARTGKPTANLTPAFGDAITISQIKSDASGHVTGATDRTITIPSTAASDTAAGLVTTGAQTWKGSKTLTGNSQKWEVTNGTYTVSLQIGSGGTNRGLWDNTLNKWMLYADASAVHLNGDCTGSSGSCTGNAATATKLATARSLYVKLGTAYNSSSPVTFDGSAAKALPVNGTLPVANGGTGNTNGAAVCLTNIQTISKTVSANSSGRYEFTLPSGGTWAYIVTYYFSNNASKIDVMVGAKIAGGTVRGVSSSNTDYTVHFDGLFFRMT